jgi:spore germination protein GerM
MAVPPPPTYRRLPGKKKGFIMGQHTLWRGRDHLLQIYARWGTEDYKRYYFNDIQAIITRKTDIGKIQNFVTGALAGLFGLFAATATSGWVTFNAIIAIVILCILIINVIKGPTCETHLLTAVQTEKLHSLNRIKTSQAVMNQLKPIIERYQGQLSSETLIQQRAELSNAQKKRPPTRLVQRAPKARKHESGRVHLMLFALLSFNGLIVAVGFVLSHVGLTFLGGAVMLMMGICVVVALVKQHESNLQHPVRTMTWAALAYVCFLFISSYIISMGLAFKNPEMVQNQWEMIKLVSNTTPWDSTLMMTLNIIALSAAVAIGIPGLYLLRHFRRTQHPAERFGAKPDSVAAPKRIS